MEHMRIVFALCVLILGIVMFLRAGRVQEQLACHDMDKAQRRKELLMWVLSCLAAGTICLLLGALLLMGVTK